MWGTSPLHEPLPGSQLCRSFWIAQPPESVHHVPGIVEELASLLIDVLPAAQNVVVHDHGDIQRHCLGDHPVVQHTLSLMTVHASSNVKEILLVGANNVRLIVSLTQDHHQCNCYVKSILGHASTFLILQAAGPKPASAVSNDPSRFKGLLLRKQ